MSRTGRWFLVVGGFFAVFAFMESGDSKDYFLASAAGTAIAPRNFSRL